jgi:uncharacterized protein
MVSFTWDERKAVANRRKHGVTFEEATTVFGDPLAVLFEDPIDPQRALVLGASTDHRILVVVHAEIDASTIRIISARHATSHERKAYEEGT